VANNGIEAFELFRTMNPDLIISDLAMPEMGGIELTRAIRRLSETPIIVLSVREQESLRFFWLIAKPGSARSCSVRKFAHFGLDSYSATCGATFRSRSALTKVSS
jgi:CheY-like chemotaxis protein